MCVGGGGREGGGESGVAGRYVVGGGVWLERLSNSGMKLLGDEVRVCMSWRDSERE